MTRRYPRPIYIALTIAEALVVVLSRFLNAVFLGGSTHQTISSRAYIDALRANKSETFDRLKFTLEGSGE